MDSSLKRLKAEVRKEVRDRMVGFSQEAREQASARARALLKQQAAWQEAGLVLLYAAVDGELNIWPLVEAALETRKVLTLPRFDSGTSRYLACQVKNLEKDLAPGRYGILEPGKHCDPVPLNRLDFILVPGVAFDLHGRRLGRGKGYYDQLLAGVRGKTCGVAFDQQIVREVPVETHDSDVNCILTPTRWIEL